LKRLQVVAGNLDVGVGRKGLAVYRFFGMIQNTTVGHIESPSMVVHKLIPINYRRLGSI
jgi:hypothetical protein